MSWIVLALASIALCMAALLGARQDVSLPACLLVPITVALAIASVRAQPAAISAAGPSLRPMASSPEGP